MSAIAIALLWSGTFEQIIEFTSYGIGCLSLLISLLLLLGGAIEKPLIALTSLAISLIGWPIYWISPKRAR